LKSIPSDLQEEAGNHSREVWGNDRMINWRMVRYRLEYLIFQTLVCIVRSLPLRESVKLAKGMAFVIHRCLPRKLTRYHVAAANLRTAFGEECSDEEIDETIYQMWTHLFRMVVEIIQLPRKLHRGNIFDVLDFDYPPELITALCSGRPVILLSGHYGNWEIAVSVFGLFGFPMGVVARELDNPFLNEWFERFRQHTGHRAMAKKGGYDDMIATIERRGHLALLGDQDAGKRGLFVDFFGKPASTFKSIALLALEYRAYICVGYARRLPDDFENNQWVKFEMGCEQLIDSTQCTSKDPVGEITQQFTTALENAVRKSPEQYFWVHRRWKSEPRVRAKKKRQTETIQEKKAA
tara:strand:+ start:37194 stop:38246 length:1053 start_codon:yes stop_codon:yes gene_type:complete